MHEQLDLQHIMVKTCSPEHALHMTGCNLAASCNFVIMYALKAHLHCMPVNDTKSNELLQSHAGSQVTRGAGLTQQPHGDTDRLDCTHQPQASQLGWQSHLSYLQLEHADLLGGPRFEPQLPGELDSPQAFTEMHSFSNVHYPTT